MTKFILFSITTLILWISTPNSPKPKENTLTSGQQEKEYTVRGSIAEYQIIFSNQDDVPKSQRDKVIQKFVIQINQQQVQDTIKKK